MGKGGRAVAHAVCSQLLTMVTRIPAKVGTCRICGGQNGTGTVSSPCPLVFPPYCYSTAAQALIFHERDGKRAHQETNYTET